MGWGNSWDEEVTIKYIGSDWSNGPDKTAYAVKEGAIFKEISKEEIEKIFPTTEQITEVASKHYHNIHPTHDPYTNPDAHIYYECGCGAILDPQTKSFAQLNNCASEKGWKIRFRGDSYQPYCVKCGENVE